MPAATPKAVVDRLQKEIANALAQPETTRKIVDDGAIVVGNTPAEFAAFITREEKRWGEVVRKAGIKAN